MPEIETQLTISRRQNPAALNIPPLTAIDTLHATPTPWPEDNHPAYEFSIPAAQQAQFFLKDSTRVWLNAETSFRLSSVYGQNERLVSLSGEGGFDVRWKKSPFSVALPDGFQVYTQEGTFHIAAYTADSALLITNRRGEVYILKNGKAVCTISPGEAVTISWADTHVTPYHQDSGLFLNWAKNGLGANGNDLSAFARRVGRWWNTDVVFNKPIPITILTGDFPSDGKLTEIVEFFQNEGIKAKFGINTIWLN
jgi:ferric-dicitrate binding protein FerR (iron transport regulator)